VLFLLFNTSFWCLIKVISVSYISFCLLINYITILSHLLKILNALYFLFCLELKFYFVVYIWFLVCLFIFVMFVLRCCCWKSCHFSPDSSHFSVCIGYIVLFSQKAKSLGPYFAWAWRLKRGKELGFSVECLWKYNLRLTTLHLLPLQRPCPLGNDKFLSIF
jgi:hypothetical protein